MNMHRDGSNFHEQQALYFTHTVCKCMLVVEGIKCFAFYRRNLASGRKDKFCFPYFFLTFFLFCSVEMTSN